MPYQCQAQSVLIICYVKIAYALHNVIVRHCTARMKTWHRNDVEIKEEPIP